MGLAVGLMGGSVLALLTDSFLGGLLVLGMASVVSASGVFTNLSVECTNEFFQGGGSVMCLVLMSLWVCGISLMCTTRWKLMHPRLFAASVLSLGLVSVMFFTSANWFVMYFFFEASLVPILVLVLGWGYQPERLQASMHLLLYMVSASLPLLLGLMWVYYNEGTVSFFSKYGESGGALLVCLCLAFLVKLPTFSVHGWLPKAHVEAPVAGSMILAGVLLKFGGWGLLMVLKIFSWGDLGGVLAAGAVVGVWGGFVCGVMCIRQVDMKALIAYSSIGHMGLCLAGVLSCSLCGWMGSVAVMLGHGLCSAGLFALAGFTYSIFNSRSLFFCRGLLALCPSLSIGWFLFCSSNMAFPPSLNLLGELCILFSLASFSGWLLIPVGFLLFIGGVYSLLLYSGVQHGKPSSLSRGGLKIPSMVGSGAFTALFLLWVPLNCVFVAGDVLVFSGNSLSSMAALGAAGWVSPFPE